MVGIREISVAKYRVQLRQYQDHIYDFVVFIMLTFIFLLVAYPLYFVIISSVSIPKAVSGGDVVFWPVGFTLEGYREVFTNSQVLRGYANSIIYTMISILISLAITLPTAYALSRDSFGGKKIVMIFYVITMFVNGGIIPTYLVIKNIGLLDNMFSLILPGALSVFNMIVTRTFFKTSISQELHDAAAIDGCSEFRFFFGIVLPLSGAIIAVMALFYGVGQWNAYFSALLYIRSESKFPLQLVLRTILIQNQDILSRPILSLEDLAARNAAEEFAELMKYSLIIISSLPVLITYPLIQKHFVKGVMIGSIKG